MPSASPGASFLEFDTRDFLIFFLISDILVGWTEKLVGLEPHKVGLSGLAKGRVSALPPLPAHLEGSSLTSLLHEVGHLPPLELPSLNSTPVTSLFPSLFLTS